MHQQQASSPHDARQEQTAQPPAGSPYHFGQNKNVSKLHEFWHLNPTVIKVTEI
jgi:hypothetical protein